jgi:hypothetical protein
LFSLLAYRAKFFSHPFLFLPQFVSSGCGEIITTFHSGFSSSAKFFWQFCLNPPVLVVMKSLQLFLLKNRLPKAWHGHVLGSGGHQTDSKPASVLANKPQER